MSLDRVLHHLRLKPWTAHTLWLVLGAPTATLVWVFFYCTGMLFGDYARTPNRHLYELLIMAPVLAITVFVIALFAQALAYAALVGLAISSLSRRGRVSFLELLVATPVLGLLAWFGYEHFVPEYRFMLDTRPEHEYGLTVERFAFAWGFETLVALGYWLPLRGYRVPAGPS